VSEQNKRIHVVINPAAGKDEPILNTINDVFHQHNIEWTVSVTHKYGDATEFARQAADQVAGAIKQAKHDGQLNYKNIAVIRKNEEGKVKIKETGDMGGGVGAAIGAVAGGALALVAGPLGLAAGAAAGAVIGGAGAALHDAGIPNERLEEIGDVLGPGNSALIAIFDEVKVDKATMKEIDQSAAETVEALAADIGTTLEGGQDVAYAMAITQDGVVALREAVGDDATNISAILVTEEGVVAGQAVATEDGVAYEVAVTAGDEVAYEAGVATEEGAAVVDAYATAEGEEASEEEDS
jgi:uncharacterized membrane protein